MWKLTGAHTRRVEGLCYLSGSHFVAIWVHGGQYVNARVIDRSVTVAQKVFCVSRRQSFRETASKWTRHSFLQRCCCLILSLMTTYYHVYVIHSTQQLLPAAAYFFISLLYIFGDYHSNWYLVIARTRAQMWPYKYDNYTRSNMFQQKQREAEGSPAKYKVVLLKPRKVMLKIRFENWNDRSNLPFYFRQRYISKQTNLFFFFSKVRKVQFKCLDIGFWREMSKRSHRVWVLKADRQTNIHKKKSFCHLQTHSFI